MKHSLLTAAAILALSLGGAEAKSWKHGEDHGRGHGKHWEDDDRVVIRGGDRVIIKEYYGKSGAHCPPGLARKGTGCLPPGQYKKYVRGQVLPSTVMYQPVPQNLLLRLAPPPPGARYVVVDNNILLVSDNSKRILDVMSLLGLN